MSFISNRIHIFRPATDQAYKALQVLCLRAMVIGVSTCGYVRHFYMLIAVVYYACASYAFLALHSALEL